MLSLWGTIHFFYIIIVLKNLIHFLPLASEHEAHRCFPKQDGSPHGEGKAGGCWFMAFNRMASNLYTAFGGNADEKRKSVHLAFYHVI